MSEEVQAPEQDQATSPRRLSMQERLDVVDCLRARSELIVAETKAEAARTVSQLSGVEVSAAQLDYIIESLPKLDLGTKIQVGPVSVAAITANVAKLEENMAIVIQSADRNNIWINDIKRQMIALADRIRAIETKVPTEKS